MEKKFKLLESLEGNGEIFRSGESIAQVTYNMRTRQEITIIEGLETEGRKLIDGVVAILDGEPDLFGLGPLVLRIADGRECTFLPDFGNPASGNFQIKVSGSWRQGK